MASKSVAATTAQPFSADVINGANLRLSNALAIADLMMECDPGSLCKHTLAGAAFVLMDLLNETKDLINGEAAEVQA